MPESGVVPLKDYADILQDKVKEMNNKSIRANGSLLVGTGKALNLLR